MKSKPITIPISSGTGEAHTKLAAFDAALFNAGIANYNLLHLSSVVPAGFAPKIQKIKLNATNQYGHKLYVVYASNHQEEPGKEAWAGLGWVMAKGNNPWGLFVEHVGESEREVIQLIKYSLGDMVKYRKERFGKIEYKVAGITCKNRPVCALVAAAYEAEDWKRIPTYKNG